jgi:predicted lipoprotein with Yx(FWY)xxD motif
VLSACGKSVTIGDAPSASTPVAAASSASPSAAQSAPGGQDNSGLQVLDTTAQQAGLSGNGGTVVGAAVQETPPNWVQLTAVTSQPLTSPHLININQASLYRFDKDSAAPSVSRCTGACAKKWPPVTIKENGKVYLQGVDPKKVGGIRRNDGQVQVTVNGWPLYRFSGDTRPGDLNGQGVDGVWFAAGPDGSKVTG